MLFLIALLLWIAPALLLGLALLWVCFGPGRGRSGGQDAATEHPASAEPAAAPPSNAVPG